MLPKACTVVRRPPSGLPGWRGQDGGLVPRQDPGEWAGVSNDASHSLSAFVVTLMSFPLCIPEAKPRGLHTRRPQTTVQPSPLSVPQTPHTQVLGGRLSLGPFRSLRPNMPQLASPLPRDSSQGSPCCKGLPRVAGCPVQSPTPCITSQQ